MVIVIQPSSESTTGMARVSSARSSSPNARGVLVLLEDLDGGNLNCRRHEIVRRNFRDPAFGLRRTWGWVIVGRALRARGPRGRFEVARAPLYRPARRVRSARRDGRVAEGARLESVYTGRYHEGSNPMSLRQQSSLPLVVSASCACARRRPFPRSAVPVEPRCLRPSFRNQDAARECDERPVCAIDR